MAPFYKKEVFDRYLSRRNWEEGVSRVCIEACDCEEDPLGYKAVFFVNPKDQHTQDDNGCFIVGASFLLKRQENLNKSGYQAPMTDKAIALIEDKIGEQLPAA